MLCHPPRTTGAAAPGSVSRGDVTPAGPAASGRGVYTHESKHNPSFRCNSDQMCRKGSAKVLPTPERFLFSLILQTPNVQVVCPSGKKRSRPSGQLLGWHAQCISAVCAIGACDVASGVCGLWPGLGARPHPVSKDEGGPTPRFAVCWGPPRRRGGAPSKDPPRPLPRSRESPALGVCGGDVQPASALVTAATAPHRGPSEEALRVGPGHPRLHGPGARRRWTGCRGAGPSSHRSGLAAFLPYRAVSQLRARATSLRFVVLETVK